MKRSCSLYFLSPAALVAIAWTIMFAGVAIGFVLRERLPVTVRTMKLNGIDFEFSPVGMVWLALSLLTFLVMSFAATRPIPRSVPAYQPADLSLALKIAGLIHIFIVCVVIVWITVSALRLGGFGVLIEMAATQETYEAKAAILANKLFPGMRLLYTGLVCLGVLGACAFAVNLRRETRIRRDMMIGLGMFLVSAAVLSILPIFLSQRILLVNMVLSTFVAVSLVSGRLFHFRYALVLVGLLLTVWSLREAVTIGDWASDYSSARIGLEKILYYLINDFYNAVAPFSSPISHTFGYLSFGFALPYIPYGHEAIFNLLSDRIEAVNGLLAGGIYPALTVPYVDFSWFGVLLTAMLAILFTWAFNRAQRSFTFAVIYGQIGGALLLGPHVAWYSNPNFTFNILLTCIVCFFIRRRRHQATDAHRIPGIPSGKAGHSNPF